MSDYRVGIGYDLHRTKAGRHLILANVKIEHTLGLEGHSDADVVLHALIDAITGAAGLPDVGQMFPNTDPKYKNIDSAELLRGAMAELAKTPWRINNVDLVIVAQAPKIAPYKLAMIRRLSELLGVSMECINIKGKTKESVDAVGQGHAIACQCAVLLRRD
ncbi:MAG TPA: 2-C-methyl-D-erythritol 2,4-cyclodiphosphate synthase [Phycisphaerae bacterium]|nr:2-C-methyl-D-erythritol 2,4-cyclodiphosphate synthase [Phycisphaerae bacterium]